MPPLELRGYSVEPTIVPVAPLALQAARAIVRVGCLVSGLDALGVVLEAAKLPKQWEVAAHKSIKDRLFIAVHATVKFE